MTSSQRTTDHPALTGSTQCREKIPALTVNDGMPTLLFSTEIPMPKKPNIIKEAEESKTPIQILSVRLPAPLVKAVKIMALENDQTLPDTVYTLLTSSKCAGEGDYNE